MKSLMSLAGIGGAPSGYDIGSGLGGTASSIGGFASFMNPAVGIPLMLGGGLTNLLFGSLKRNAEAQAGQARFDASKELYDKKIKKNDSLYSTMGIKNKYALARHDLSSANMMNNRSVLDRYSSIQRRTLANNIKSGLTAGTAQANKIQSDLNFQKGTNDLFANQAQQMSQLRIKESQDVRQALPAINARKQLLARSTLQEQGIINPAALGGLTSKLVGY